MMIRNRVDASRSPILKIRGFDHASRSSYLANCLLFDRGKRINLTGGYPIGYQCAHDPGLLLIVAPTLAPPLSRP